MKMSQEKHRRETLKSRILRGGGLISAGTMATRLLGLLRELLTAAFFGAGGLVDAFVVAFSVPSLFRRVLGEEMFERAFMPPFKRLLSEGKEGKARTFLRGVFIRACLALAGVSILVLLLLPWLVSLLAPGLAPDVRLHAISLGRMILPFLFLIGISSFTGALLQFSGRLLLFSLAPALTNTVVVVVLFLFHRRLSISALVLGWLCGAAVAILVQAPAALKIYRNLRKTDGVGSGGDIAPALREGGNVLLSSVVSKSVEVVDRIFASMVGAGAISALYFSFRLVHLPFSVLSLALSRSLAPEFSRLRGEGDLEGLEGLVHFGLGLNFVVLTPVVLFLMLFSSDVIALFYGRGAFGHEAVARTALAYLYYAPAILPMGLIALLNRVYASLEDNRIPLLAAFCGGLVNVVLDAFLYRGSLHQGGIALASSIGLFFQAMLMMGLLRRWGFAFHPKVIGRHLFRLLVAAGGMGFGLMELKGLCPLAENFFQKLILLLGAGLAGFGVYAVIVAFLWPEWRRKALSLVRRKIGARDTA